jgi:hypothetical protein
MLLNPSNAGCNSIWEKQPCKGDALQGDFLQWASKMIKYMIRVQGWVDNGKSYWLRAKISDVNPCPYFYVMLKK